MIPADPNADSSLCYENLRTQPFAHFFVKDYFKASLIYACVPFAKDAVPSLLIALLFNYGRWKLIVHHFGNWEYCFLHLTETIVELMFSASIFYSLSDAVSRILRKSDWLFGNTVRTMYVWCKLNNKKYPVSTKIDSTREGTAFQLENSLNTLCLKSHFSTFNYYLISNTREVLELHLW